MKNESYLFDQNIFKRIIFQPRRKETQEFETLPAFWFGISFQYNIQQKRIVRAFEYNAHQYGMQTINLTIFFIKVLKLIICLQFTSIQFFYLLSLISITKVEFEMSALFHNLNAFRIYNIY